MKNFLLNFFESLKRGCLSIGSAIANASLTKMGDLLLLLDARFQKKKYYTLVVVLSLLSLTWIIAGVVSFSTRDASPDQSANSVTSSYTPQSKSSSLKPLQDYYLSENKLDLETMTDMIVSSSEKDKELDNLYQTQMKTDLQSTDFFQQEDRVIQNEIRKLIQ